MDRNTQKALTRSADAESSWGNCVPPHPPCAKLASPNPRVATLARLAFCNKKNMTQSPTHPALDKQHLLFFAKKTDSFLAEHKHILLALKQQGCRLSLIAQSQSLTPQNILNIYPITFSDHGKNPLREAIVCAKIIRLLYRLRPQIIIAYTLKPILYSALSKTLLSPLLPQPLRLVAVFTGLGRAFLQPSLLHKALTLLLRPLLRNAAQLWVLNEHNKTFLQTFLREKNTNKILVGKDMGIDLTRFRPHALEKKPKKKTLRFLYLGRLLKAKGVSEYLEAARLLQHDARSKLDAEFWLVGSASRDDPDRVPLEEVEKAAAQGFVKWCGEHKRVEDLLASADCLVLPSYAEGLPRVILEAAAMRVPAIVARYAGWQRAVVANETALVCACRDAHELAKAMRTFAALPPQQRYAMGEAARAFVLREFSEEEACRFYLSSLNLLLTSSV